MVEFLNGNDEERAAPSIEAAIASAIADDATTQEGNPEDNRPFLTVRFASVDSVDMEFTLKGIGPMQMHALAAWLTWQANMGLTAQAVQKQEAIQAEEDRAERLRRRLAIAATIPPNRRHHG